MKPLSVLILPLACVYSCVWALAPAEAWGQGLVTAGFESAPDQSQWVTPIQHRQVAPAHVNSPPPGPSWVGMGGYTGTVNAPVPASFPAPQPIGHTAYPSGGGYSNGGGYSGPGVTPHDLGVPHPLGKSYCETRPHFYLGLMGGANLLGDWQVTGNEIGPGITPEFQIDVDFDPGIVTGTQVGLITRPLVPWYFERTRVEGEFSYRQNRLDALELNGIPQDRRSEAETYVGMANIYFDAKPIYGRLKPYIGFGVGAASVGLETRVGDRLEQVGDVIIDDSDTQLAWQAIVGVNYEVIRDVELFCDFRYLGTAAPTWESNVTTERQTDPLDPTVPFTVTERNGNVEGETTANYTIMFGVRWLFGRFTKVNVGNQCAPGPNYHAPHGW